MVAHELSQSVRTLPDLSSHHPALPHSTLPCLVAWAGILILPLTGILILPPSAGSASRVLPHSPRLAVRFYLPPSSSCSDVTPSEKPSSVPVISIPLPGFIFILENNSLYLTFWDLCVYLLIVRLPQLTVSSIFTAAPPPGAGMAQGRFPGSICGAC